MPNFSQMTKAARQAVLDSLATTPERKALLDQVRTQLEAYLSLPETKRAWVVGSFTQDKPNPSDLDVLLDQDWERLYQRAPVAELQPFKKATYSEYQDSKLHLLPSNLSNDVDARDDALVLAGMGQKPKSEGGKGYRDLNWKRILGIGGLATGGAMSSSPDAEAGLAPEVRKLYQATLAKNKGTMIPKAWYHTSQDPGGLVMAGTKALPEAAAEATVNEHYKPFGLYLSETPQNISGHLTGTWNMGGTTLSNRFKGIVRPQMQSRGATDVVRAVTAPDSRILSWPEAQLQDEYQKFRAQLGPEFRRRVMPLNEALEHKVKTEWTKHLQAQADVLHIDGVDGTKDVPEYLHLNPDKLSMFYENKARTPETGVTTAPWARPDLKDSGSVRQRILNRLVDKGIVYPETGRPPSTSILKGIGGMNGIEVPEVNWKAKDPNWQAKADQWYEDSGKLLDAKDDAAAKAAKASDMFGEYFGPEEGLDLELEKFILGVGAGGLAYAASPGEAQAMPLGKLKPESLMDTVKSSALPRSETALDRALGKKLNLHFGDGDSRKPYEIVDIRKGKDDKRFVIVKDESGNRHQLPMTSDYLNAMLGSLGTEDYLTSFKAQGLQGKKIQSLKSLGIREAKKSGGSIQNDNVFRDWNSMQAAKAKEIDPALVRDYVYVKNQQNETLYMPKAYADFLASKGHVKILGR